MPKTLPITEASPRELRSLRRAMDCLNIAIFRLHAKRLRLADRIMAKKANCGLPRFDPEREREQIERMKRRFRNRLDEGYVDYVFRAILRAQRIYPTQSSRFPVRASVSAPGSPKRAGSRAGSGSPRRPAARDRSAANSAIPRPPRPKARRR
jgi:chorismate mutase